MSVAFAFAEAQQLARALAAPILGETSDQAKDRGAMEMGVTGRVFRRLFYGEFNDLSLETAERVVADRDRLVRAVVAGKLATARALEAEAERLICGLKGRLCHQEQKQQCAGVGADAASPLLVSSSAQPSALPPPRPRGPASRGSQTASRSGSPTGRNASRADRHAGRGW
jgi:hypothetical protein